LRARGLLSQPLLVTTGTAKMDIFSVSKYRIGKTFCLLPDDYWKNLVVEFSKFKTNPT
jgi:hypothetical protein